MHIHMHKGIMKTDCKKRASTCANIILSTLSTSTHLAIRFGGDMTDVSGVS